jgi:hypothetical protein
LADGRRAFFKGVDPNSSQFAKNALLNEERFYRELAPLISDWIPALYANFHSKDWHVLLLEDLGPKSVPPWTPTKARQVAVGIAEFHRATLSKELPSWVPFITTWVSKRTWNEITGNGQNFENIATTGGTDRERVETACQWLQTVFPLLTGLNENVTNLPGPYVLLHFDIRSDNLRLTRKGLRLFDWPFATCGSPEWDLVEFAQSVTVEGGVAPEKVVEWYAERLPVNTGALDSAISGFAGFLADQAWRPEIPGLPRLRTFQRQQLSVLLHWLARRHSLPEPDWLD